MPPVIDLGPNLDTIYGEVERLLAQGTKGPLYSLAGRLVWVEGSGSPKPHTVETIRLLLSTIATYQVTSLDAKGVATTRQVAPPVWLAKAVLDRATAAVPALQGAVAMPLWQPPATVLSAGYDVPSALLVRGAPHMTVRPRPSSQAKAATDLAWVLEPWADFPFTNDRDRAVLVALIVTILVRHTIRGPVPLFGVSAPLMGTGKTMLAELVGLLTLGAKPGVMLPTTEEAEMRKRILSIALKGHRFVLLDNVMAELRSPSLAAAVTGQHVVDRILGKSEVVEVRAGSVWAITGNALILGGDLERRALTLYMDAGTAHPNRRHFNRTPEALAADIAAKRPAMLRKLFGALAGYYCAGAPTHLSAPLGSFEAWDNTVRSFVIWCGLPDPVEDATTTATLDTLLKTWHAILGDTAITTEALMAHTSPSLKKALPPGDTAKTVGRALAQAVDKTTGKLTLSRAGRSATGLRWRVTTTTN